MTEQLVIIGTALKVRNYRESAAQMRKREVRRFEFSKLKFNQRSIVKIEYSKVVCRNYYQLSRESKVKKKDNYKVRREDIRGADQIRIKVVKRNG